MKPLLRALLLFIWTIGLAQTNTPETVYFLVASPRESDWALVGDSYVLPLTKQEDIDHARYLVSLGRAVFQDPSKAALVVAKVGPGKDGINRNYLDPRFTEWSWHIIEFRGFGDFTIDWLNGSPTAVENDRNWYCGNDVRQGLIGFWAYTVVRELGAAPLYLSIVPEGLNLQFFCSGVGTNYVYALEGKESLTNTIWLAIPGAAWPLKTNHWTLPLTSAPARFYRVKAEASTE